MKRFTATTALQFLHDDEGEPCSDESENENDASEIETSSETSSRESENNESSPSESIASCKDSPKKIPPDLPRFTISALKTKIRQSVNETSRKKAAFGNAIPILRRKNSEAKDNSQTRSQTH
jgi:hypothetical protein